MTEETADDDLKSIKLLVDHLAEVQAARRNEAWRSELNGSDRAALAWIARDCDTMPAARSRTTLHPQECVEAEAEKLSTLWRPNAIPDDDVIDDFLHWIPHGGFPGAGGYQVTAAQLMGEQEVQRFCSQL